MEPVAFDRNHYCIDVTFYYRIIADTVVGSARPATLYGLAVFSKRAVLCGEDSCAHIYRSDTRLYGPDGMTRSYANRPTAVVEVLDPMVLSSRVRDPGDCSCKEAAPVQVPDGVRRMFDEELNICPDSRRLFVTLGQFSIIRLERDAQLKKAGNDYMDDALRRTEETIAQALRDVQDTRMKFIAVTESQEQRKAMPNVDVDM